MKALPITSGMHLVVTPIQMWNQRLQNTTWQVMNSDTRYSFTDCREGQDLQLYIWKEEGFEKVGYRIPAAGRLMLSEESNRSRNYLMYWKGDDTLIIKNQGSGQEVILRYLGPFSPAA